MADKQTQALTVVEDRKAEVVPGYGSVLGFDLLQRGAKALSASSMVPENYSGNVPNCIVALEMSLRMRVSPLMVMQNLHVIKGKPSWSSAFLIGALNGSPNYTPIRFVMSGEKGKDSRGCVATTVDKSSGEIIEGPEVTIAMAKADGWYGRKDSKWPRMPELMLRYRAGAWLVRTVAPEMTMGFPGDDEVLDSNITPMPADVVVEPGAPQIVETDEPKIKKKRARRAKPADEPPVDIKLAAAMEQTKEPPAEEGRSATEVMENTNAPEPVQAAVQPQTKQFKSPF